MIIDRIAYLDTENTGNVICFMVQSIAPEEKEIMNFLVGLWDYYNRNDYLTDKQQAALICLYKRFVGDAKAQHPQEWNKAVKKNEAEPRKGFKVYEGGKK